MAENADREFLMSLSDKEVKQLARYARRMHEEGSVKEDKPPDNTPGLVLPEDALKRLEDLRKPHFPRELSDNNKKWLQYTETLLACRCTKPRLHGSDREIYAALKRKATARHMPPEFARSVLPLILNYVRSGSIKPLLLSGIPGTGKTTAGRVIAELLGMSCYVINSNIADTGHSLFGEASSFTSPDIGELARGIVSSDKHSLNVVYVIDEVEKAPTPGNRSAVQDELLSALDGNSDTFRDNFLQYSLPLDRSIFILTANDPDRMIAPLRDRCVEIPFGEPDLERVSAITKEYAARINKETYSGLFNIPDDVVLEAANTLFSRGATSIRQYERMIDMALSDAYASFLESDAEGVVDITAEHLVQTIDVLAESRTKTIGFASQY